MPGNLSEWTQQTGGTAGEPWWWSSGDRHGLPKVVVIARRPEPCTCIRCRNGETRALYVAYMGPWLRDSYVDALHMFDDVANGDLVKRARYATIDASHDIERLLDDVRAYVEGV